MWSRWSISQSSTFATTKWELPSVAYLVWENRWFQNSRTPYKNNFVWHPEHHIGVRLEDAVKNDQFKADILWDS